MPKKEDPYRVIEVQNLAMILDMNSIYNVVSLDKASLVIMREKSGTATTTTQVEHEKYFFNTEEHPAVNDKNLYSPQEYAVGKVKEYL